MIKSDLQDISECFQSVGISPQKVHAQPLSGRVNLGKRELNTAISTFQEKVARALNVTPEEINLDSCTTEDRLMQPRKEKFSTIKTNKEVIQLLTLAPEAWSIKK